MDDHQEHEAEGNNKQAAEKYVVCYSIYMKLNNASVWGHKCMWQNSLEKQGNDYTGFQQAVTSMWKGLPGATQGLRLHPRPVRLC